jgi:sugar phosphate isomerase/epimerase
MNRPILQERSIWKVTIAAILASGLALLCIVGPSAAYGGDDKDASGAETPAELARKKLGWRLGISAYTFHQSTFFEAIDKTAALGLKYFGGFSPQKVSKDIPKSLDYELTEEEQSAVRAKLESAGVQMPTYYIHEIPPDEAVCRKIFDFCRALGVETIVSEPAPEALDVIEKFCDRYGINLAIHNHAQSISSLYWDPKAVMKVCKGRGQRVGACPDQGHWIRGGLEPIESLRIMRKRVITLHIRDVNEPGDKGTDVVWGTGCANLEEYIREVHRLGIKPTLWGIEFGHDFTDLETKIQQRVEFFDKIVLDLADGSRE